MTGPTDTLPLTQSPDGPHYDTVQDPPPVGFFVRAFGDYRYALRLAGRESRRDFWTFVLIGIPLGQLLITICFALVGAVLVGRALPADFPGPFADPGAPAEIVAFGQLLGDLGQALRAYAAPVAAVPEWVFGVLLGVIGLIQGWHLLSLVAATRRRLTDAGSDRSLAWVWPFLPLAAVLNVPGGLIVGTVMVVVGVLVFGRGPMELALLQMISPIWLPGMVIGIIVVAFCLRRSRPEPVTRPRRNLWWVLLLLFAPAIVGILVSLPIWAPIGESLAIAAEATQQVLEVIMFGLSIIIAAPLVLVGLLFGIWALPNSPATTTYYRKAHWRKGAHGRVRVKGRNITRKRFNSR